MLATLKQDGEPARRSKIKFELFAETSNASSLGQDMAGRDRRRRLSSSLIHRTANAFSHTS
ncbi:hypothetical protein MPC4_20175 [Methylocella tundrae]|uniref:Uncharacterized protein n=1 Tax=Methylocella tundrae TaxID=227605 RepID=A0A4U8Z6A9_METTU|nr:protein of unknown function [Methylocella tundrae]VTZ26506.1 hypothetical protein MPC1_3260003 [Methylocella tundrae]VTZ49965.1 hypothetical protein MPC4_20175 [Methylocella tundrae]